MRKMPKPESPHPFTLIELLVVVAIISVLASMLLPALMRARGAAKGAACLNHIKQIYFGFQSYTDENDDFVPSAQIKGANWTFKLGETGAWGDPLSYSGTAVSSPWAAKTVRSWEILRCPGEQGSDRIGGNPYWKNEAQRSSYLINFDFGQTAYGVPRKCWSAGPASFSYYKPYHYSTSEAGIVMDMDDEKGPYWQQGYYHWTVDDPTYYTQVSYAFRHNSSANMLYWDGHGGKVLPLVKTGESVFHRLYPPSSPPKGTAVAAWPLW